jgi:hypothetical protein
MTDVRTNAILGGAAARRADVALNLDSLVATARTWRGMAQVEFESPPTVAGGDIILALRTKGMGADTILSQLADAFPQFQVQAAYAGEVEPPDAPTGRYVFNEERGFRPATLPPIPTAPTPTGETAAAPTPPPTLPPGPPVLRVPPTASAREPALPTPPRAGGPTGHMGLVGQLVLNGESGSLPFNITTRLSARSIRPLGEDARFWDTDWQFTLERTNSGWQIVPNPSAPNETLLNGHAVTASTRLGNGDIIGVGREAKGIIKLPLTVRIGSPS